MDANYDEFGNYIGPEDLSDNEWESDESPEQSVNHFDQSLEHDEKFDQLMHDDHPIDQSVNESAVYFPNHAAVYGPDTEIVVGLSDAQPISQPIIAPTTHTVNSMSLKDLPECSFDWSFMFDLQSVTSKIRNVSLIGGYQHGKTSLIDRLVQSTHLSFQPNSQPSNQSNKQSNKQSINRFTDHRNDEIARGMSIKSSPMSLVMTSSSHVSHLIRFMDCPGHCDFFDEVLIGLRASDACIVVIDCCEGITPAIRQSINQAIDQGLHLMIVISKIDRLIIELKLPPTDAYAKLVYVIDELNDIARTAGYDQSVSQPNKRPLYQPLSPARGNVCFSSTVGEYIFSLQSVARTYISKQSNNQSNNQTANQTAKQSAKQSVEQLLKQASHQPTSQSVNVQSFAKQLWGDKYFHSDRVFRSTKESSSQPNTFIQFVLNPLYKIYAHTLGADTFDHFNQFHQSLTHSVNRSVNQSVNRPIKSINQSRFDMNPKQLLPTVFDSLFGDGIDALIDMIVEHCPSPEQAAFTKLSHIYSGPVDHSISQSDDQSLNQSSEQTTSHSPLIQAMISCDAEGPLMADVVKLYHRNDSAKFDAFIRVYSGSIKVGDEVRVLGSRYSLADQEDQTINRVSKIWIYQGRYRVEVPSVTAGNWALVEGIDASVHKMATICSVQSINAEIFKMIDFSISFASLKLAIEPLNPSELPSLLEGLRAVDASYPGSWSHVEESGEHVIAGPGELYLDCALHDLRRVFTGIEIKVSEPSVRFVESVSETSSQPAIALTANQSNELLVIAEPLEPAIVQDLLTGRLKFDTDESKAASAQRLEEVYHWDELASHSVWDVGPQEQPTNMFCDYTIKTETDHALLSQCIDSFVSGFHWATREGPLCDEPIRGVKFSLIRASFASRQNARSRGQLIPAARQACLQAFLFAAPILMEPVYLAVIQAPADCLTAITSIVSRRRGFLQSTQPIVGTPMFECRAEVPVIDSVGFQVDIRTLTQGQAFALCSFSHFARVPGDPLDASIPLRPLEPSPTPHLARDFMVKTRRRKGLSADVVRI